MTQRVLPESWRHLSPAVRDAVLKRLIEKRRLSPDRLAPALVKADRARLPPASLEQAFFLQQRALSGETLAWTMAAPPIILERVDAKKVAAALTALAARHDVLHSLLRRSGDGFTLVPDGGRALDFTTKAVPITAALTGAEAWVRRRYQDLLASPFDAERGPLWRAELCTFAGRGVILLSFCSAIIDGESLYLIDRDLRALLAAPAGDALPVAPFDYADYAETQAQLVRSGHFDTTLDWWRDRLAGGPPAVWASPRNSHATAHLYEQVLGTQTGQALDAYAASRKTTPPVVLLTEYMTQLRDLDRTDDLWVASATADRQIPGTETMVGTFARQTLLRHQWRDGEDQLAAVQAVLADAMEQPPVPHLLIRQDLERAYPDAPSAFRYIFNHRLVPPAAGEDEEETDIAFRLGPAGSAAAREEDILFMVMQTGERRLLHWYLRGDRFTPQDAEDLLLRFRRALDRRLGI